MSNSPTPPRRIAIAAHPKLPKAVVEALKIKSFLEARGITVSCCNTLDDENLTQNLALQENDLFIVIGGDGTMLRAGHLCAPLGLPILGINMGRFGFLYEIQPDHWPVMLPQLLEGNFWLEKRMMLRAELWVNDQQAGGWDVINEVVVCRGHVVRPIHVSASVDGYHMATYVADGLIAATPTGSTAYALAVGGPIMPPELRNILVIPIAPHLSVDRAVILPEGACVTITANTDHEAVFSIDGHPAEPIAEGGVVKVSASSLSVSFTRFHDRGFFYRNLMRYMENNPSAGVNYE